jgi:hypothetical protein
VLHVPPISSSSTYYLILLSEEYKSRSSSLFSCLHSPVTSSLFGPDILLSTLFSNTLSLCSSLNVRDQVSHPNRTTGKIIVLYIVIFIDRQDKGVENILFAVCLAHSSSPEDGCSTFLLSAALIPDNILDTDRSRRLL